MPYPVAAPAYIYVPPIIVIPPLIDLLLNEDGGALLFEDATRALVEL